MKSPDYSHEDLFLLAYVDFKQKNPRKIADQQCRRIYQGIWKLLSRRSGELSTGAQRANSSSAGD